MLGELWKRGPAVLGEPQFLYGVTMVGGILVYRLVAPRDPL
jgi:hypothetical protein